MTCRKPTISVRMETLERLARANSDPDAPDSLEFCPMSWRDLDRDSLTEGLNELLAYQAERQANAERRQKEEDLEKARWREQQRAQALRWEQQLIERRRGELLLRRVEAARERAAEEIQGQLTQKQARLSADLKVRAHENAFLQEVAKEDVLRKKKRLARTAQVFLAAAGLVGVVWVSAFSHARKTAGEELAEQWQASQAQELSAETRVLELESEIERRVNLTESEREWLQTELGEARAALDASKKEREEIDRRRPVERPSKMAQNLVPVPDSTRKPENSSLSEDTLARDSLRVATDVVADDGCSDFDPLCFDL